MMRDIVLLAMLLALGWASLRRPWVGLLALIFVGVLHPQGYASGFMQGFPAYVALFSVVVLAAGWHFFRQRAWPRLFWDWRMAALAAA